MIADVGTPARSQPDRSRAAAVVTGRAEIPPLLTRTEDGCVVAVLSGAFDITRAPVLREQLIRLLRPATSRLVLDMSLVSHVDAGGLAVLVGTARRARLLGGFLRLAAVGAAVAMAVGAAGLDRQFEIFPTVRSAVSSPAGG
jgi:anti-sigma B factor antagonist